MKKLAFSALLSLLLLVLDFSIAHHHHEDHGFHTDCQLCLVQHQPQHKEDVKVELNLKLLTIFVDKQNLAYPPQRFEIPHSNLIRAPPVA